MKSASIRVKLIGLIMLMIIAIIGTSSYILSNFKQAQNKSVYANLEQNIITNTDALDKVLSYQIEILQIIANMPAVQGDDVGEVVANLKKQHQQLLTHDGNVIESLGIIELDGMADNTDDTPVDLGERDYFKAVVNGADFAISEPIISKVTNQPAVVVAVPIKVEGQLKRALYSRLDLTFLNESVNNIKYGERGRAYIVHTNGVIIAHTDPELLMKDGTKADGQVTEQVAQNINEMLKSKRGVIEYEFDGAQSIVEYSPMPTTDWVVAIVADRDEAFAEVDAMTKRLIIIMVVISAMLLAVGWLLTNRIVKPLHELVHVAEVAASGDLTTKINIESNDEVGALAKSFKEMIDSLVQMIVDVKNTSNQLASHSMELAASSAEVSATVEEVASTTNEVATIAAQGADNAVMAAGETEQVQRVAEEGNISVLNTVEKMNSIATTTEGVSNAVNGLGKQSEEIGQIINTITNIAEQTNLLALNAAIEAARAGEHGRGFAVVAEEVRKLAEQSAQAANEITSLVKEIQVGVENVVNAMEHGALEVSDGVQIANHAGASLEQIIKAVRGNVEMIKDIASGSKQANEGTQQLSAANEQISSTIQQVSGSAQELSNIAEELQSTVSKFKVD